MHINLPSGLDRIGMTMFSADGREVMSWIAEHPGQEMTVDVSNLPAGAYFLRCQPSTGKGLVLSFLKE
jgi:hypothetical protein